LNNEEANYAVDQNLEKVFKKLKVTANFKLVKYTTKASWLLSVVEVNPGIKPVLLLSSDF
jgi:hypothetical protein